VTVPSATRRAAGSPHQHRRNDGRCRWPQPRRAEYRRRCPAVTATAHRRSAMVSFAGPHGPAGQAPPDPYKTGPTPQRQTRPPDRGWVAHGVGARRCLARPRHQARETHGRYRPVAMAKGHCPTDDGCRCRPVGRRVRHRLTPTRRGSAPHCRTPIPDRGWVVPPCRGEAPPRPPRRMARHMRVADRHAALITTDRRRTPVVCRPVGRRVRQRLTPTGRRRSRDPWRVFVAPPMRLLNPVGTRHGLSPPQAGYYPDEHGGVAGQRRWGERRPRMGRSTSPPRGGRIPIPRN
jgi:hypothetical protein